MKKTLVALPIFLLLASCQEGAKPPSSAAAAPYSPISTVSGPGGASATLLDVWSDVCPNNASGFMGYRKDRDGRVVAGCRTIIGDDVIVSYPDGTFAYSASTITPVKMPTPSKQSGNPKKVEAPWS